MMKSLWTKLESLYASKSGNNKLFLIKQLLGLKYTESKAMSDHLNDFHGITRLPWKESLMIKFRGFYYLVLFLLLGILS